MRALVDTQASKVVLESNDLIELVVDSRLVLEEQHRIS